MKWWVKPYLETQLAIQKINKMNKFPEAPYWFWEAVKEVDFDFFLISDTHWYHHKIAEYCERPDNWDEIAVQSWNETVSETDIVFHLGDFSFGNKQMAQEKVEALNGRIILLKGNHDRHGAQWFHDIGIKDVIKNPFIMTGNHSRILFSHVPQYPIDPDIINIHGHIHNIRELIWERKDMRYRNVSVEALNYKPIKFKELL